MEIQQMRYIERIKTNIPNSERHIDFNTKGKNIIFTGGNGCGKTQLINHLYDYLKNSIVHSKNYDTQNLQKNITQYESILQTLSKADAQYSFYEKT